MNLLQYMQHFRRANGEDVEQSKQPVNTIYQFSDGYMIDAGTLHIMASRNEVFSNWIFNKGKIICKFKVYRK